MNDEHACRRAGLAGLGQAARLLLVALSALGLLLPACGGGGGGSETTVIERALAPIGAQDGYANSDGIASSRNQSLTGDLDATDPGVGYRAFFAFDLSPIPNAAQIQSARFRVWQRFAQGGVFSTHGPMVASHVRIGDTLDASDYSAGTIDFNIGTVSNTIGEGWRELEVRDALQAALGALPSMQLRLEHLTRDSNDDGMHSSVALVAAEDVVGTGNPPELIVRYTLP